MQIANFAIGVKNGTKGTITKLKLKCAQPDNRRPDRLGLAMHYLRSVIKKLKLKFYICSSNSL